jgi:CheY-like chemotaxis protein
MDSSSRWGRLMWPAAGKAIRLVQPRCNGSDDEFGFLELLEAALTDEGHHVLTATNGRVALDRLRSGRLNLIITDFVMPEMGGRNRLRGIGELHAPVARLDKAAASIGQVVQSFAPSQDRPQKAGSR